MHRADKYSEHSLVILTIWPNGWVFVYEVGGCKFVSLCSDENIYKTFLKKSSVRGKPINKINYASHKQSIFCRKDEFTL